MPTFTQGIVGEARTIARLQLRRRKLRSELKKVEEELRHARKILRKLAAANEVPWNERRPASKVFGLKGGE